MELHKKMVVKVAVLLFLLGFTATVDARFDPSSFVTQMVNEVEGFSLKPSTTACCDKCICTRSFPPQCQCLDTGATCHSACKKCLCPLIWPPACRCYDVTNFCYDKCNPSEAEAQ